MSIDKTERHY